MTGNLHLILFNGLGVLCCVRVGRVVAGSLVDSFSGTRFGWRAIVNRAARACLCVLSLECLLAGS